MDNKRKLFEGLLKADGIDPAGATDSERSGFRELLDGQLKRKRTQPDLGRGHIWRVIMKTRVAQVATAVALIAAAVLGVSIFVIPQGASSIALADVEAEFAEQSWVFVKYDNGREEWHDLVNGRYFEKRERYYEFQDRRQSITHFYRPGMNSVSVLERGSGEGAESRWQSRSPWEIIVSPVEKPNEKLRMRVEKHTETVDGQELVRFDVYRIDALDREVLSRQLWADPASRLPVRLRRRPHMGEHNPEEHEFITAEFSFPQTGPATIYDLGVPAEMPMVNILEQGESSSLDAEELTEAGKVSSENFLTSYRAVIWPKSSGFEITVIYRRGQKIRVNTYVRDPRRDAIPATVDGVVTWIAGRKPYYVRLYDGEKLYDRNDFRGPGQAPGRGKVKVSKQRWPHVTLQLWYRLDRRFWPHAGWAHNRRSEIIDEHPEAPDGTAILLVEGHQPGTEKYFFVDMEKDNLCVGEIGMRTVGGVLEKRSQTWWSDFTQLPSGHWYPSKERTVMYPNAERGTVGTDESKSIHILPLEEEEFPANVFNGEPLLENAEVTAY